MSARPLHATATPAAAPPLDEFERLLDARDVRVVFQPLVDLGTGDVVGYEALARGPAGSAFERPDVLFAAAYRAGRVAELDWVCRAAAYRAALAADLHPTCTLFVNAEPTSPGAGCPDDLQGTIDAGTQRLRVVLEVTERAVAADPSGLLAAVARIRAAGLGVALDDVGAEPGSLAVMPFVQPDVIKLDLRLLQDRTTTEVARIVAAVAAQAERSGAAVLAEGIETARHLDVARALGATLGQGYRFGQPGELPAWMPRPRQPQRLLGSPVGGGPVTPFTVVAACRATRTATKDVLLPISRHLEQKGVDEPEPIVLLACFQKAGHFTPATRRRYAALARRAAFTAALGVGMPAEPQAGIRGANLAPGDRLRGEWDVIIVGPHFAGALVARDLGDHDGPEGQRRFEFALTHDRDLVVEAARTLLGRVIP